MSTCLPAQERFARLSQPMATNRGGAPTVSCVSAAFTQRLQETHETHEAGSIRAPKRSRIGAKV